MQSKLKKDINTINQIRMKNPKDIVETALDSQAKSINNWIESTQKFQKAVLGGEAMEKGTNLYNEWLENQMSIFKNATNIEGEQKEPKKVESLFENNGNGQDYLQNLSKMQMESAKKMMDFSRDFFNNLIGTTKTENLFTDTFNVNNPFGTLYNNWINTLTNTYESLSKNLNYDLNKNAFTNMFNTTNVFMKFQEMWAPVMKGLQSNLITPENFRNFYNTADYKKITEQVFNAFFNENQTNQLFQNYTTTVHNFFKNNQGLSNEYFETLRKTMEQLPKFMVGDVQKTTDILNNMNDMFVKSFAPLMKMVAPGKEKENIELILDTMDKISVYSVRETQMQYLLYTAGQKAFEKCIEMTMDKVKAGTEVSNFQQFFNEWVNISESAYTDLFSSDEFSKIKGEVLTLSLGVRRNFEKQFETNFNAFPIVFKSEMEDLYKTIYDLKKTVKNLETRLASVNASALEMEEDTHGTETHEKISKGKKK